MFSLAATKVFFVEEFCTSASVSNWSSRVCQSGQAASLEAASGWIFSSLDLFTYKFQGVAAVGSGLALGLNFNGRKELLDIIAKRDEVNDNRFRDLVRRRPPRYSLKRSSASVEKQESEDIMGLLSNKIDRQELKLGDHIYCWRQIFIYAHHGIYVDDGKVIHFNQGPAGQENSNVIISSCLPDPKTTDVPCPQCGDHNSIFNNGTVIISCIDCFLSGGELNRFEYGVSPAYFIAKVRGGTCTIATSDPPGAALHRANILLENGFGEYDVFKNNCEDFAIYCKTGLLVISPTTRVGPEWPGCSLGGYFKVDFCVTCLHI
ncbi:hypothetical protein Dsin_033028 [Dipteronia sinensis]|uniref:LRAT domain-containing protein n=1 Tax=Dipteronia sinensis TaxID=43782 RepID=A0AAD9ZCX1_9ROSI|nr:hypothetical protein Dsin_033028 [Dipteronia sinensis]